MIWLLWIAGMGVLAFANGANDNAKGVATLIGGGVMRMRPALWLAAGATFAGSVTSIWLGAALVESFKGHGIVDLQVMANGSFPLVVALAAAGTVLLATRLAMPISTTHAMVGAIVGVGLASGGLIWSGVWAKFLMPLLAAPLLAMVLAAMLYLILRAVRRACGISEQTCLCIGREHEQVGISADGTMVLASTGVRLTTDQKQACSQRYTGAFLGLDAQPLLDKGHIVSAVALSFARGVNDTPKIAAVLLASSLAARLGGFGHVGPFLLVGLAIAAGGLLAVRRVAQTVSFGITGMNDGQSFTASVNAAILVIFASPLGLPVSTTHVICGSLFGIGAVNRRAHWSMIAKIAVAWVTTLPVAIVFGVLVWSMVRLIFPSEL